MASNLDDLSERLQEVSGEPPHGVFGSQEHMNKGQNNKGVWWEHGGKRSREQRK